MIALLKRSMGVFYFILLLIVIDAIDRLIIHRMDTYSNLVIDDEEGLTTNNDKSEREK